MRKIFWLLFLMICCLSQNTKKVQAQSVNDGTMSFFPLSLEVILNEVATINVTAGTNERMIKGFTVYLKFRNQYLSYVNNSIVLNPNLINNSWSLTNNPIISPDIDGYTWFIVTASSLEATSLPVNTSLFSFQIRGVNLTPAESNLELDPRSVFAIADLYIYPSLINGSYTVAGGQSATPTPTSTSSPTPTPTTTPADSPTPTPTTIIAPSPTPTESQSGEFAFYLKLPETKSEYKLFGLQVKPETITFPGGDIIISPSTRGLTFYEGSVNFETRPNNIVYYLPGYLILEKLYAEANGHTLLAGDLSQDNQVTEEDVTMLFTDYDPVRYEITCDNTTRICQRNYISDFNFDGLVNALDYSLMVTNMGKIGSGGVRP